MTDQKMALRQVEEIMGVIKHNVKTIIPGSLMIAIGLGVMAIPGIEWLFSKALDPFFMQFGSYAKPLNSLAHTLIYWIGFTYLGNYFNTNDQRENAIIKQVFAIGRYFPLIPVSMAACLALSGNSNLISPIILILIGCLFVLYGQFTSRVITIGALSIIVAGLIGILLTQYSIPHLWGYLIVYQGFVFVIMGLLLQREQKTAL